MNSLSHRYSRQAVWYLKQSHVRMICTTHRQQQQHRFNQRTSLLYQVSNRSFSSSGQPANSSTPIQEVPPVAEEKLSVEELMKMIDMEELKKFNPKLHEQIANNPSQLGELQDILLQNDAHAKVEMATQAMQAAAENLQYKPPKIYSLPFIWAYFTPVFTFTAAAIIKLQAATTIPWFPFIIMCGFGVRLLLAPLMIRQMVLINKIGQASPNIRLVMKLFKQSKMSFLGRLKNTFQAIYDYSKQTNTNLLAFYFYNLIQIPVFIVMVLSIRKISFENDDLANAGIWWFKNLNEADPYLILPIVATILNYVNLGRGIYVCLHYQRKRTLVRKQVQIILPSAIIPASPLYPPVYEIIARFENKNQQISKQLSINEWPAGAFVYWISSSFFVFLQSFVLKKPWFLNKINPNFFYDYSKLYGERAPKDHENYVERLLNAEDHRLKQYTNDQYVMAELEFEMKRFFAFQRMRKMKAKTEEINPFGESKKLKEEKPPA